MIFSLGSENEDSSGNNAQQTAVISTGNSRRGSISTTVSELNDSTGLQALKFQNTVGLSGIANYLWETGKRRFSTPAALSESNNTFQKEDSVESTDTRLDKNSDIDMVDENSYQEAANLLKESTAQKSISYNSLSVSNDNVFTTERTEILPDITILPTKTAFIKIKEVLKGTAESKKKHLYLSKDVSKPPTKIVIIGLHGFFPHPNIRKLIGNPTGTSHRFIQEAEKSIRQYYEKSDNELEIFSIALEKEGKVFERVDYFYDLLCENETNLNKINQADMVYIVAHSQGCPTALILLAKLLKNEIIVQSHDFNEIGSSSPKLGVLCMAGIMNGPVYYKDRHWFTKLYFKFEGDRLLELFQFQYFDSLQMTILRESIEFLIFKNCKITFVGSLTDQLVPLYSSCCYYLKPHPNIFRSCYVDNVNNADLHKKKFLINLVRISLKLLNLGHSDNKMLLNISQFLIGKMNGKGHSSLYYDSKVYLLGFRFAWETSDIKNKRTSSDLKDSEVSLDSNQLKFQKYHIEKLDFTNKLNTSMIIKKLIWASLGFLNHLKHLQEQSSSLWDYFYLSQAQNSIQSCSFKDEFLSILDNFWDWKPEISDKDMATNGESSKNGGKANDGTTISDLIYWKNGLSRLLTMNGYDKYKKTNEL
ncbi:hypothetical protein QEN19_001088 [Hanseniaspora menglaensis]